MTAATHVSTAVRAVVIAALAVAIGSSDALARGQICQRVASETMEVDGLLDDWSGFRKQTVGSGADHSFALRCAYDDDNLYVALDVADDRVYRTGGAGDSIRLRVRAPGGSWLTIQALPGTRGFKPKYSAPRWATVADSQQPAGFSVEVGVPLAKLSRWSRTVPLLFGDIAFADADGSERGGNVRWRGKLHFSGAVAVYRQFVRTTGIGRQRFRLDTFADVDLGKGAERIISAGDVVGVLSDSFAFMKLPVSSPADVLSVKVVNFSGTGRAQIVAHYRQRGNGTREIVGVWQLGSGQFEKLLAVEVKKQLGDRSITNRWSIEKAGIYRKARRARGWDLVIEATEAVGFDEDNYREARATDANPILLPWDEQTSAVYYFDGDRLAGGEPMTRKRRRR